MFTVLVGSGAANNSRPRGFEESALRHTESESDSTVRAWAHHSEAMANKRSLEDLGKFLRDAKEAPFPALLEWVRDDARLIKASDISAMRIAKRIWDRWNSVRVNRVGSKLGQHTCDQLMVLGSAYLATRAGEFAEECGINDPAGVRPLITDFRPFYDDEGMVAPRRLCRLLRPDNIKVVKCATDQKPRMDDIQPIGYSAMIEYRPQDETVEP